LSKDQDQDEVESPEPGSSTMIERLLPPVDPLGEDGHPKPTRMDHREQLVAAGLGFANVAIAAGAASGVERQQALVLLAGLLASAVTLVGARVGNRIVAILGLFACVVTRNADTFVFLAFGLPYYAAAMWMFLRYNRITKAQATRRRAERVAAKGSAPSTGKGSRPSAQAAAASKPRPSRSKRYTPPKPAKKRPPPPPKPPRDRSIVD
jgi:hypothetical protein